LKTLWACVNADVCPPITTFYVEQTCIRTQTQAAIFAQSKAGVTYEKTSDVRITMGEDAVHKQIIAHHSVWSGSEIVEPQRVQVAPDVKGTGYIDGFDTRPMIFKDPNELDLLRYPDRPPGSVRVVPLGSSLGRSDVPPLVPMFGKDTQFYENFVTFSKNDYENAYSEFLDVYDAFSHMYGLKQLAKERLNRWNPEVLVSNHWITSNPGLVWQHKHCEMETPFTQSIVHECAVGPLKNFGPELRGVLDGTIPFIIE